MQKLSQYFLISALAGICTFGIPASAFGQNITFNFASPLVTSGNEAPGVWYPDRFPPCGFSSQQTAPDGTHNVLEESVCATSYQSPSPSFFNTQGRKYDLVNGTYSISISLYVPGAWATQHERKAGFWATGINATGVVGNDYPIIEFQGPILATDPQTGPGFYSNGGVAGFYGWDNTANGGNGGFKYIGLPPGFFYNTWVELTMTVLPGKGYQYTVSDFQGLLGTSIKTPFVDPAETTLANVILEGYNYDLNESIYWNSLSFSSSAEGCSVLPGLNLNPLSKRQSPVF